MGVSPSVLFAPFAFEDYWLGKHWQRVKQALKKQFPGQMVKSVSDEDLYRYMQEDHDGFEAKRIVVVYSAQTNETVKIMRG